MMRHNPLCRAAGTILAALAFWLGLAGLVSAHGSGRGQGPVAGVPIAEITHGQMPVIADHAGAILALAGRFPAPDAEFGRVLNYAKIQRAWCLWGRVPGAVTDEASPFNACSHAWLAATQDLLVRMEAASAGRSPAVAALARRVEGEMLLASTSLSLCAFSATPYDTAVLVRPVWADVLRHPVSLGSLGGAAALLAAAGVLALRWLFSRAA
ncbi:hypothetical protein [Neotabrizicola sp. VNH66]|uniref:hypothetical protein n=1 Tax=Neotabrizicola sp. VNH66 TaxID=3400918 RepID=UPI003C0DA189